MANACNDRMRSGIGDPTYRIAFNLFTAARQIRNPDGSGTLFAPQAEFFEQYQTLEPTAALWPPSPAGTAEGVNVATPLGCFVFGRESANIDAEADRIANITALGLPSGNSLASLWALAKSQRGAIDPQTGAIASPALDTARLHMRIAYSIRSPYGTSYGGFQPLPEFGSITCDPVDGISPVNFEYKFTSLLDGSSVTYPGSCPEEPSHVAFILRLSDLYIVVLNNGDTDYYRRSDWIEGPYTGGGQLKRDIGGQLDRALDRYVKDFRGTEAQRGAGRWNAHAFDFQAFLTRQYSLAPQRGTQSGDEIIAQYPSFTASQNLPASYEFPTGRAYADGYILDAIFVFGSNVQSTTTVEIIDESDAVVATATLAPNPGGTSEALTRLRSPVSPQSIRCRLPSGVSFAGGSGWLSIEATELYPYKPNASDAYVLLRSASASQSGTVYGSGLEEEQAREIWEAYRDSGVILTRGDLPQEQAIINSNAVFDAFRRMSKHVRILSRQQLIGYEVANGKSILYFRRRNTIGADSFVGIGPSRDPVASGSLVAGKRYSVRSGTVWYKGAQYVAGSPFTAQRDDLTYFGAAEVYEHDGILHDAPVGGFSNEWLIGFQFKAYHPSESSIWKPSAYSDYFAFSERCHFYHPTYSPDLQQHFDYGATLSLAPEAATGYRYAKGTNIQNCDPLDTACIDAKIARYKSCRIYEPDVEIDSAETLIEGGQEVIKLTLTGRLHHSDDAVASIARDISTWDVTALRAESYRSTENAIREYLVWAYNGTNAVAGKPGDSAVGSGVDLLPDNPFGTVFPTIILTQLLPKPYEDGNDRQNAVDSKFLHDMLTQAELYLRCMCEGYVDGRTSEEYACATGISGWYDYTFQNLCFDAFRGQWISPLGSVETDALSSRDIRDDRPQGFGPYPNTLAAAEVWNQFANAWNLLTRARVMLPLKFEAETRAETDAPWTSVNATSSTGAPRGCTSGTESGWYAPVQSGADAPTTVVTPRAAASVASSDHILNYIASGTYSCDGERFNLQRYRQEDDYWLDLVDPDSENAMPPSWRAQVQTDGESLFVVERLRFYDRASVVPAGSGTACGTTPDVYPIGGGNVWLLEQIQEQSLSCELLPAVGTVTLAEVSGTLYGSVGTGATCSGELRRAVNIEPVATDAFILSVPLS